jgi:hypothetical protein
MTNREAIGVFQAHVIFACEKAGLSKAAVKEVEDALDLAISALEKQEADRWIPVTERLPEEYGEYRITWKTSSDPGKRFIGDAEYEPGFEWDDAHDRFFGEWLLEDYVKAYPDVEVTAWKPIGEPYTEEEA